jgi:1,4-dihydroxy-2-naphthoate octaprenyltransferase
MVATAPALSPSRVWWSAVRPATLAASIAPVLVGTAISVHEGEPRLGAGLLALLVAVAMQIGVNFANDYSDHKRGADSPRRVGPLRAASSGIIEPAKVRRAAIASFGVAAAAGVLLSLTTDWRLLLVGVACLLAGWLYTGGPRPYGYLGLGEAFVFVFFGLVATLGTVYVETLRITQLSVLMACAMGCFATAILVLNNLRDLDTDVAAGKLTLATRIGRERTRVLLLVLVCIAFAIPIGVLVFKLAGVTVMLVHFAIPIAAVPVRAAFAAPSAPALVRALKRMAIAELAYALLFSFGLLA